MSTFTPEKPSPQQIAYARQLLWERGKRLAAVPATKAEMSAVINRVLTYPPLPTHPSQAERFAALVELLTQQAEDFVAPQLPNDRAAAARLIRGLENRIRRNNYRVGRENADAYITEAGAETPASTPEIVVDTTADNVTPQSTGGDDIPF